MHLIMVRHGKAESDAPTGRDADRLLRPRGESQARHVADALAARPTPPRLILSSGIIRAVQTARILQQALGCTLRVEPALETGGTPSGVIDLIERECAAGSDEDIAGAQRPGERGAGLAGGLVIVGHNPTFEELAGILTSGLAGPPMTVRTGEALVLEVPGTTGDLIGGCTLVESIRLDDE